MVPNSIDAVSNRDFVLDFLSAAATCATHLSRLGAEIVLWSSEEFGFCRGARRLGLELVDHAAEEEPGRGRAAAREGAADRRPPAALHGVMHGLPLTYNKDMQEDKEHLFDTVDTLELCLAAARGMLGGITFKRERLAAAATDEMLAAVDVADMLVKRGVPFRQSHGIVAGLVREAVDLRAHALRAHAARRSSEHADVLDDEFYAVLSQGSWLESKESEGGTKLDRVREQLAHARAALDAAS